MEGSCKAREHRHLRSFDLDQEAIRAIAPRLHSIAALLCSVTVDGVLVAEDVEQLHDAEANNLSRQTALDESGAVVNGRGDEPDRHDILAGSDADGMPLGEACADWTSSGAGPAMVGHHDRTGGGDPTSWNAAHGSRGCSLEELRGTGGAGLFYRFASDWSGSSNL